MVYYSWIYKECSYSNNNTRMASVVKSYGVFISNKAVAYNLLTGSSRFVNVMSVVESKLIEKKVLKFNDMMAGSIRKDDTVERETQKRLYGMNVSKFRQKAVAYSLLRKSLKFLAFYSISFPGGIQDDICYRIFNSVLTRLRRDMGLKSYMWVMERQKNGTIHYHMLTHDYMNVREVNRLFAVGIEGFVEKGLCTWGRSSLSKYNGVDVKAVIKKGNLAETRKRNVIVERVIGYLAKYMSKEIKSESHRVWHCSRLVSALFISSWVDDDYLDSMMRQHGSEEDISRIVECQYGTIIFTKGIPLVYGYDEVIALNEKVYQIFEENDWW